MSEMFGTLVLARSPDADCDMRGLVESLNKFNWSDSSCSWQFDENDADSTIYYGTGINASAYPTHEIAIFCHEDGTEHQVTFPSESEIERADDIDVIGTSLAVLAEELSRHIRRGSIEIACAGEYKCCFVFMDRLIIHSTGMAKRTAVRVGECSHIEKCETVDAIAVTPSIGRLDLHKPTAPSDGVLT